MWVSTAKRNVVIILITFTVVNSSPSIRFLLKHAVSIAGILAVGYSIGWIIETTFTALILSDLVPYEGIATLVTQTAQFAALLYVVRVGVSVQR